MKAFNFINFIIKPKGELSMTNSMKKPEETVNTTEKAESIKGGSAKWRKVRENVSVWYTTLGALGALYMLYQFFEKYGVCAFITLTILHLLLMFITERYLNDEQIIAIKIICKVEELLSENNINEQSSPEINELTKLIDDFKKI